jgi:hypothetical protein
MSRCGPELHIAQPHQFDRERGKADICRLRYTAWGATDPKLGAWGFVGSGSSGTRRGRERRRFPGVLFPYLLIALTSA